MTEEEKDKFDAEFRWGYWLEDKAISVLGPCSCLVSYTRRKLIDPKCIYHDCHDDLIEALQEAYDKGRLDYHNEAT